MSSRANVFINPPKPCAPEHGCFYPNGIQGVAGFIPVGTMPDHPVLDINLKSWKNGRQDLIFVLKAAGLIGPPEVKVLRKLKAPVSGQKFSVRDFCEVAGLEWHPVMHGQIGISALLKDPMKHPSLEYVQREPPVIAPPPSEVSNVDVPYLFDEVKVRASETEAAVREIVKEVDGLSPIPEGVETKRGLSPVPLERSSRQIGLRDVPPKRSSKVVWADALPALNVHEEQVSLLTSSGYKPKTVWDWAMLDAAYLMNPTELSMTDILRGAPGREFHFKASDCAMIATFNGLHYATGPGNSIYRFRLDAGDRCVYVNVFVYDMESGSWKDVGNYVMEPGRYDGEFDFPVMFQTMSDLARTAVSRQIAKRNNRPPKFSRGQRRYNNKGRKVNGRR